MSTLLDQVMDVDAHEMVPTHMWADEFGESSAQLAVMAGPTFAKMGANNFVNPELVADNAEITSETVWHLRGTGAPSAADLTRRPEVMDEMGCRRQLVFPSYGVFAMVMAIGEERRLRHFTGTSDGEADIDIKAIHELGLRGLAEYNEWAIRTAAIDPDRLRPVAYVLPQGDARKLIQHIEDLLGSGIRAISIPSSVPPAGTSPANPVLDPLWALLAEANVPVTVHVGGETGFVATMAWADAPPFAPGKVTSTELGLDPYSMSTFHNAITNFLTTLVLGGVFERHPTLRFGAIECGAHWLGPLAENLDLWATKVFGTRLAPYLKSKPSEYLARNVRVTPFALWEDIRWYFERYPHLADCYCYSTDYPHFEGGEDSMRLFYDQVSPLGETIVDKFFRTNGKLLLPD
jgi:predicted TIM-barrel fold metal-dependent hydrolase